MYIDLVITLSEMPIEDFEKMSRDDQILYLTENLRDLNDDLIEPGIDILIGAGETEFAIALAKDTGRIDRAIKIAIEEGDYLWAALIAKKAGRVEDSKRLYREGLEYYRSEEHTSELKSRQVTSDAVFCLKKKTNKKVNI